MTSPDIVLRAQASLVEEHLTDAIAFVLSHYKYPSGADEAPLAKSRISALLNVLAGELCYSMDTSQRHRTIQMLARDIEERVSDCRRDVFYDPCSAGPVSEFRDRGPHDGDGGTQKPSQVEALMNVPMFRYLMDSEIRDISDSSTTINCRAGDVIIEDGDSGEDLFVILDGAVDIQKRGRSVTRLGAGEIVGEMAMLSHQPRSASVVMAKSGDVIRIPQDVYAESVRHHPEMWRDLCAIAVARLQTASSGETAGITRQVF